MRFTFPDLLLTICIFLHSCVSSNCSNIPCPLQWVDGGDSGNSIPDNVVAFSASEIAVRVKVEDNWVSID